MQISADLLDQLSKTPINGPPSKSDELGHNPQDLNSLISLNSQPNWPILDQVALPGLPGRIVRKLLPHTEADPVALLVHLLAEFSCLIGRGPHIRLDGSYSPLLFWPVNVGDTSKSRKGSAAKRSHGLFQRAIPDWNGGEYRGSLSSGEGLAFAVRDPIFNPKGELMDQGVADKRLFLVQTEFGAMLRVMAREGNSLSGVLRDAWDGEDLRPMTKQNRIQATGPHIVVVGHTTQEELRRNLTDTEMANGFGNRFVWFAVRRSKFLPFADNPLEAELKPLIRDLSDVARAAQNLQEIGLSNEAAEAWKTVYPELSKGKLGLAGTLLDRAEAQTRRVAALYALLDGKSTVELDHLRAALALWQYAEDSVRWIFGNAIGDPIADAIEQAIRASGRLSDTEISQLFGKHVPAARLAQAKALLQGKGLIEPETETTEGRSRIIWTAKKAN